MPRRRVEIAPIDSKSKRHTTFTKRRQGIFKKTSDLCDLCGCEAAAITFSAAGNLYVFAHPHIDTIIGRYNAAASDNDTSSEERRRGEEESSSPWSSFTEAEKIIVESMGKGRSAWDAAIGELGLEELDELAAEVERIKSAVAARIHGGGNIPAGGVEKES